MKNKNYYQSICIELIKILRGELSQNQLNNKLKSTYNKVGRWESGSLNPSWNDFRYICKAIKIDFDDTCYAWIGISAKKATGAEVARLLIGHSLFQDIAKNLKCSESTCRRWVKGETDIKLAYVFALLDFRGKLTHFISSLIDIKKIPILYKEYSKQKRARTLFADYPESSLLTMTLWTDSYLKIKRPSFKDLAQITNINLKRVEHIIIELEELSLIKKENAHYKDCTGYLNFSWSTDDEIKQDNLIKKYWAQQALDRMPIDNKKNENIRTGFEIFVSTERIRSEISQEMTLFRSRIHEILESTPETPGNSVFLLNTQLIDLIK